MAEPSATLAITLTDLQNQTNHFMGFGRLYANSNVDEKATIDFIIQRGLRQFYFPPALEGEKGLPHVWSFLYPSTTITVFPDLTGTCTTSPWNTTALVDTGAEDVDNLGFQNGVNALGEELVGQPIAFLDVSANITYTNDGATPPLALTVSSVTDKNNIVVANTIPSTPASSTTDTYILTVDGNYNLPIEFGGLSSNLTFDATTGFPPITITSEARIRALRQNSALTQVFRPSLAAVRPLETGIDTTQTTRQLFELMLWPKPDATYLLHYRYIIQPADLTTSTSEHPLGGTIHAETLLASCLASAEGVLEPARRVRGRHDYFMQRLAASVMIDRNTMVPESLGVQGDASGPSPLTRANLLQKVSYNDTFY